MIDLTPLDIRKKREDFRKALRGYDPEEVDAFLTLVSERLEELVKENLTLRERVDRLQEQVSSQLNRERAVQEALVTAQKLRDDIEGQAQRAAEEIRSGGAREADLVRKEAEVEAQQIVGAAHRQLEERREALDELERRRLRFLRSFRALLERELDVVEVEEARAPLQDVALDLDFRGGSVEFGPELESGPMAWADEVEGEERTGAPMPEAHAEFLPPGAPLHERPAEESPAAGPREEDVPAQEESPAAESHEEAVPAPEGTPVADPSSGGGSVEGPPGGHAETPAEPPPPSEESSEDDPKRWLSSLVERELSEKTDQDSWG
jgi:DivIVA domain-containing protein